MLELRSFYFSLAPPLNGDILLGPLILLTNYKAVSKQIVNVRYLAPVRTKAQATAEKKRKRSRRETRKMLSQESHA